MGVSSAENKSSLDVSWVQAVSRLWAAAVADAQKVLRQMQSSWKANEMIPRYKFADLQC